MSREIISCINVDKKKLGEMKKVKIKDKVKTFKNMTLMRQDLGSAMKLTVSLVRSKDPSLQEGGVSDILLCTWPNPLEGRGNSHCVDNKDDQILNPGTNPIANKYESKKRL